jgi:hypothetical protein
VQERTKTTKDDQKWAHNRADMRGRACCDIPKTIHVSTGHRQQSGARLAISSLPEEKDAARFVSALARTARGAPRLAILFVALGI